MKIKTYEDIEITVLSQSENAQKTMQLACDVTQKRTEDLGKSMDAKLANYLAEADHTSVFEHASMSFLASGISRSLLAQVTRQRMFSFTSASQHYQDYRDYPMSVQPEWDKLGSEIKLEYRHALNASLQSYIMLIKYGVAPEEARQVLPNACTVNLVITANPRSLLEFLNVRLCERNTLEMQLFARKLYKVCYEWIPEIFVNCGPACITGKCNQGAMSCRRLSKE